MSVQRARTQSSPLSGKYIPAATKSWLPRRSSASILHSEEWRYNDIHSTVLHSCGQVSSGHQKRNALLAFQLARYL